MLSIFWVNPALVISGISLLGCFYFLYLCFKDAKALLASLPARRNYQHKNLNKNRELSAGRPAARLINQNSSKTADSFLLPSSGSPWS